MRVVVTGGAGFIGSNITDALLDAGHDVCVIDNLDPRGGGRPDHVSTSARFEQVDIRDRHRVEEITRSFQPEVVCHQAAQTSVVRSVRDPAYDADVNVVGMLSVLNAAVASAARRVVFASSAATYGTVERLPIDEATPQRPISPYGMTKLIGERYLQFFAREHGLEFTILRYGNVYGPRQNPDGEGGVVAIFVSRFLRKDGVTINGDGEQTRDFIYVGDVARANLLALDAGCNTAFVVGTGVQTSVTGIYAALADITGCEPNVTHAPRRSSDALRSYFDPIKASTGLGWRAEVPLADGLRRTVSYYAEALGRR